MVKLPSLWFGSRQRDGSAQRAPVSGRRLRVITYNVHGCVGVDGVLSPVRVAEALAQFEPDVVALQELDVSRHRSRREDQPAIIAETLRMEAHFAPSFAVGDERYGNAVLSRFPLRLHKAGGLPRHGRCEPRGAMWAEADVEGRAVQIINTHLGLSRFERAAQARELVGPAWAGHPSFRAPSLLCGDLNAVPTSAAYRAVAEVLRDARHEAAETKGRATFPGRWPAFRIDHVFVGPGVQVDAVEVLSTPLTRVASDHLPLLVTLVLPR